MMFGWFRRKKNVKPQKGKVVVVEHYAPSRTHDVDKVGHFDSSGFVFGMMTGTPYSPTEGFSSGAMLGASLHHKNEVTPASAPSQLDTGWSSSSGSSISFDNSSSSSDSGSSSSFDSGSSFDSNGGNP